MENLDKVIKRVIGISEDADKLTPMDKGECKLVAEEWAAMQVKNLTIPRVMPRILHFIDENGNNVDVNADGVNVTLKRNGTLEFYRSFGFAGRKELTPVYGA